MPQTVNLTESLADPVELKALHMVNTDPNRTPTFVMFGNPDFFFVDVESMYERSVQSASSRGSPGTTATSSRRSATRGSGWSGRGSRATAIDSKTWTDHTNLRPTIM